MAPTVKTPDVQTDAALSAGVQRALSWFGENQDPKGFWVGQLFSNSCMEAEWILAQFVLGLGRSDPKFDGVVAAILRERRSDGSWGIYHKAAGGDINTTFECYVALRLAGREPGDPLMSETRSWIFARGGPARLRNFSKYWMALLGEWDWDKLPTLPPELIAAPRWFPFNLYRFASWARGTMIPLMILSARRTCRPLPAELRLDELFPEGRDHPDFEIKNRSGLLSWGGFFTAADAALRAYQNYSPWLPGRETAIKLCLEWILKHQEADGAWSGIQPPWIYGLMALHQEGYALSHPVLQAGLSAFDKHWKIEAGDAIYLQASESPVWDTGLTLLAVLDAHDSQDNKGDGALSVFSDQVLTAARWLLDEQITTWGDWQVFVPDLSSGGWAFEFENDAYPDTDDTAVVLIVLQRLKNLLAESEVSAERDELMARIDRAIPPGTAWMVGMQSSNGGWGAFDKDNDSKIITKIPFCDFGEVLDPPSVDVSAHVLEALALQGRRRGDPVIDRAVTWIYSEQEEDGSWFGRWGCNYIYGTGAVLPALEAVGEDMSQPRIRKAADWIAAHQNDDGGWGETCASYMDAAQRGVGPSTASQTAWALLALIAADAHAEAVQRGVDFLLETQTEAGDWEEPEYTATGFPGYGVGERIALHAGSAEELQQDANLQRAFMIKYDLYRCYFPLMALARARRTGPSARASGPETKP